LAGSIVVAKSLVSIAVGCNLLLFAPCRFPRSVSVHAAWRIAERSAAHVEVDTPVRRDLEVGRLYDGHSSAPREEQRGAQNEPQPVGARKPGTFRASRRRGPVPVRQRGQSSRRG
jgi:hypothetical protein